MHRAGLSVLATSAVFVLLAACEDEESPCRVDIDCPQGTICRDQRCGGIPSPDAGAIVPEGGGACSLDGAVCVLPDECCSRLCTDGRCASLSTPPQPPRCAGLSELCLNDCCPGLTCISGVCR